jgi:ribosomal protein S18 acetylase RimI-like enzyme
MLSQQYDIRPATADDLTAVRAVLVTTWHDTYDAIDGPEAVTRITNIWHSIAALQTQLAKPGISFLVATARDTGAVVATSLASLSPDEGAVTVSRLYILPALQRSGLGQHLLKATLAGFPQATRVSLEVAPQNARAIAFYRAQGFHQVSTTQNCGEPGSGLAALIYEKTL